MASDSEDWYKPEFLWVRGLRGELWPRLHREGDKDYGPSGYRADRVVARFQMKPEELSLSLQELAERYPVPQ